MTSKSALSFHRECIIIDAVCPLVMEDSKYLDWYREGGATVIAPTVGGWESAAPTLARVARWHRILRERDDLIFVRRATDAETAKQSDRLGIYLHLQGVDPIEDNLDLVDLYRALGVGVIQMAYNVRNRAGDGCEERTDGGLSRFGIRLVERLNQAHVIIDCSHTAARTAIEVIECSNAPVVLSHSNVFSVHPNVRNVSDDLIERIAGSGGVIGIAGFPSLVGSTATPCLDSYVSHIDAIVTRVGIDYVGLGIDYYWGQSGVSSDEDAIRSYNAAIEAGRWSAAYPPPPHRYPAGIETPRTLPNLTFRLLERGYTEDEIRKLLGGNWLRVMRRVWG